MVRLAALDGRGSGPAGILFKPDHPRALVFDVGANVGNRSKIFLKMGCRVAAVEPQAECARMLRACYGGKGRLEVIEKALGSSEGEAEMRVASIDTLSSLSPDWIDAVQRSGRFAGFEWDQKRKVKTTTLDRLIEDYGKPAFIKIDVEGFDLEVVRGLSRPVEALSPEFSPETMEKTVECMRHLSSLDRLEANFSAGESMRFLRDEWFSMDEMRAVLNSYRDDMQLFGDVYLRFVK